jgi:hypothetical protein
MGPGTRYLREHCPAAGFEICRYADNYPTDWIDFLFSRDPAKGTYSLADRDGRRRIADEQVRFYVAVLRADPVGVLGGIAADVLRQLLDFRVDLGRPVPERYRPELPPDVYGSLASSRAAAPGSAYNAWFTATAYAGVLATVAYAATALWRARARRTHRAHTSMLRRPALPPEWLAFAWTVVASVVANAIVCAALASPYARFQSRVVWLLPFLAVALWMLQRRRAQEGPAVDRAVCATRAQGTSP